MKRKLPFSDEQIAADRRIWRSWICRWCGTEHPPQILVCDCVKPREAAA